MTDQHVDYLLTAFVHGELPPHLQTRVSRHLQRCDACYVAYRREQALARLLQDRAREVEAPPETLARLLPGIIAGVAPARSGRRPGYGPVIGLSLLLLLLVPALALPYPAASAAPGDQPSPQIVMTVPQSMTDAPRWLVASPTAVAVRAERLTEPPPLNPSPVPVLLMTLGS